MWPEPVERIAALLRGAGVEGTLEELPRGADGPPGMFVRAFGFVCGGRLVVALTPGDRELDSDKLAAALRCTLLRSADSGVFPYRDSRVVVDRSALTEGRLWVEAGSPRHVLGLQPSELLRLTRAETADLLVED